MALKRTVYSIPKNDNLAHIPAANDISLLKMGIMTSTQGTFQAISIGSKFQNKG